jgi:hypothetical protein
MSLATFKRKTEAKYNNNSVGQKNFSINGTTRNQGWVGQQSLSRSIIKTPMVGNTPRGSGGCCGKYPIKIVCPPQTTLNLENNSIIKPSVLSNSGNIATQYRWIKRPQPFSTVKPDSNLSLNNSSGAYTLNLERLVINSIEAFDASNNTIPIVKTQELYNIPYIYNYTNYQKRPLCSPTTKTFGTINQSSYIQNLNKSCTDTNITTIPYKVRKEPFAGFTAN